jgi:sec-independent protein translocase protein TatB
MFGLGFSEIMIIVIVAILFLGPDKLPSTMVEVAKFFRNMKNTIGSVKNSIEEELHVSEIQKEAMSYKKELLNASSVLESSTKMLDIEPESQQPTYAEENTKKAPKEPEAVTFEKKVTPKSEEQNV